MEAIGMGIVMFYIPGIIVVSIPLPFRAAFIMSHLIKLRPSSSTVLLKPSLFCGQ